MAHICQENILRPGRPVCIKFCKAETPEVELGAKPGDGEWLFWVKDNGIGVESDKFEQIFKIFKRLHTREEYPGTGMGLAICKRIMERHGGRIWVESVPGKKTTFYCAFPAKDEAGEPQP